MKVINFEEKKRQKEELKRYEYIQSMCQFQRPDLFDKLIAEQELTDEKIASCEGFMKSLEMREIKPLRVFDEAVFIWEDEFYDDWTISWYTAIDEALVFYAFQRENQREYYEINLKTHPYFCLS